MSSTGISWCDNTTCCKLNSYRVIVICLKKKLYQLVSRLNFYWCVICSQNSRQMFVTSVVFSLSSPSYSYFIILVPVEAVLLPVKQRKQRPPV